jgi:hypothetical protein
MIDSSRFRINDDVNRRFDDENCTSIGINNAYYDYDNNYIKVTQKIYFR